MKKRLTIGMVGLCLMALVLSFNSTPEAQAKRGGEGGRGEGPVIFVTSQGLYYDSIVVADPVPPAGPFQVLELGANGLQTEFGPGDQGYVGGRWVEDIDGDKEYHYFVCPLLGPGRESP